MRVIGPILRSLSVGPSTARRWGSTNRGAGAVKRSSGSLAGDGNRGVLLAARARPCKRQNDLRGF